MVMKVIVIMLSKHRVDIKYKDNNVKGEQEVLQRGKWKWEGSN